MTLLGLLVYRLRTCLIVILVWLALTVAFAEEPKSLIRGWIFSTENRETSSQQEKILRVVSLNCAGGNLKAAEEVMRYEPDIVLLQEAPARENVELLANKLFDGNSTVVWNIDTAIIVRGRAEQTAVPRPAGTFMTQAHVWLASGIEIYVISVRLIPPEISVNLLSPACWKKHKKDRQLRRSQVTQIAAQLDLVPKDVPVIVGGDFNTTAGDGAIRILGPRLHDSFREGGVGWGHTALNSIPLFRVDQIWVSEHFKAVAVFSNKTENSDHRMVISDLKPAPQIITDSPAK